MKIDRQVLDEVKSRAHQYFIDLAPDPERDTFLAKCYTNAVIDMLNKRGMLCKCATEKDESQTK